MVRVSKGLRDGVGGCWSDGAEGLLAKGRLGETPIDKDGD